MTPGRYALAIYRGDTYRWKFTLWADAAKTIPTDLTGVTAAAKVRTLQDEAVTVVIECTIEAPNIINAVLSATESAKLPLGVGRAEWDLQLTQASGDVATVLAGNVDLLGDVTRAAAA